MHKIIFYKILKKYNEFKQNSNERIQNWKNKNSSNIYFTFINYYS